MGPLPCLRSNPLFQKHSPYLPPSLPNPNPRGVYIFLFKPLRTFVRTFKLQAMTKREQLVFDFIKAYVRLHGIPPSYEVIAKGLGLKSRSNIHRIVHNLKDDGLIETKPHKFHAIRIVDKSAKEMAAM